ncbi:MAG: TauD/TfdA family dioxygenase [Gammaproteobacteria bacterium]|nr:TauD/TfdA family dioxygenase [Gammaproteobacteria bacterium]
MTPFLTENREAYERWRDGKLTNFPRAAEDLLVPVSDPRSLTANEIRSLQALCRQANMAIYISHTPHAAGKDIPRHIGKQLGLVHLDNNLLADEDAISSIQVTHEKSGRGYIPYTNRRILWHTDGYYNSPQRPVRAMILHCVRPAVRGGINELIDHEIAYILLREQDPAHIRALMAPDAMTIPANEESGENRGAVTGPVFSIDSDTGCLHMRYTARTRSIVWKDNEGTRAAVAALEKVLADDSPYKFRHRLNAGEGLVCNNVLHNRSGFEDEVDNGAGRLLYRARYHDRIIGTDVSDA